MKKKLLFVDDEAVNLLSLKALFRREYEVFSSLSAEEALALLDDSAMDVVVSDQRMPPGMSGTQFFSILADRPRTGTRVILTAYPEDPAVQEALRAGIVDAVLDKPLRSEELAALIEGPPAG